MPRLLERTVDTFTVSVAGATLPDSSQIRRRLPLGATISRYKIRFTGNLVVTVAGTVSEDAPLNYLRSIDLVLGGSFAMRVHDARFIQFQNRLQRGTANRITAPSGAVGTTAFVGEIEICAEQDELALGLRRAFLLDTRPLNSIELVFTSGAPSAMLQGGGTSTITAGSIQIVAVEALDLAGVLSRMQVSRIQASLTATGLQDTLLPGAGIAYRGVALHYTSGNADPILATSDNTILTDVSLIDSRGVRYFDAAPYEQLRSEMKRLYNLEAVPDGWTLLDFTRLHTLDDILFTQGIQNLILRQNVGAVPANTFVQIYPWNALLIPSR